MIKKLIALVILVACSSVSYWYGAVVGSEQSLLNSKAYDGIKITHDLRDIEGKKIFEIVNKKESELDKLIVIFGKSLKDAKSFIPGFNDVSEASKSMFVQVVEYRLSNPRIIDGVEYSPFNENALNAPVEDEYERELQEHYRKEAEYYKGAVKYAEGKNN